MLWPGTKIPTYRDCSQQSPGTFERIADLALKKENLKLKLANRKSKYYLLPNYKPKSTETQLYGHKLSPVYLYQIAHLPVKENLWLAIEKWLSGKFVHLQR